MRHISVTMVLKVIIISLISSDSAVFLLIFIKFSSQIKKLVCAGRNIIN
jgi:hypothetical protein